MPPSHRRRPFAKLFRKGVFWCHLTVGVCVALVVLILSVTGVLLTYERQVTAWADTRGRAAAPPTPDAPRLGADELLLRLQASDAGQEGGRATSIRWAADRDAPVAVSYGRERTVFVNAYTGAVLGEASEGARTFFRTVTDWHRWLGAEGAGRRTGRAITGACNLGFLFLIASGFYLWWPRNWTRKAVRNVTLFRRGLSPKARDFNWHNVVGFWSLVPLFVVVASGVVISYPWAGDLVYRLAADEASERQGPAPARAPEARVARAVGALHENPAPEPVGMDDLFAQAARRQPGWRTITLQVPAPTDSTVTFSIDRGTGGQPQKRAQLTLSRTTGAAVGWEPFAAEAPGRRLSAILRFAHTGEVLGIWGQTLAGLVSLGASVLVWTGLALAWRRLRSWRRRRSRVS